MQDSFVTIILPDSLPPKVKSTYIGMLAQWSCALSQIIKSTIKSMETIAIIKTNCVLAEGACSDVCR